MKKQRLLDTNLIVRHLVQDHERHARAASSLFGASDRGEVTLIMLPIVIAECVFVLESFYKLSRMEIARALGSLMTSPGIELADLAVHLDAFSRYANSKLHFVDCMIASSAAATNIPIATFDNDFKKFPDVTVQID